MEFEKRNILADLGTGEFKVKKYIRTVGNKLSEVAMANGYFDRTIMGSTLTVVLEGEFDAVNESAFFSDLLEDLSGMGVIGAEIDGETCPNMAALSASVTVTDDSRIGKFRIVLAEL